MTLYCSSLCLLLATTPLLGHQEEAVAPTVVPTRQIVLQTVVLQASNEPEHCPSYHSLRIDSTLRVPDRRALNASIKPFIGQPISINQLNHLARHIESFFSLHDFPITYVTVIPNQDITDGVVRLLVTQGRLGAVTATGARYFSNKKIAESITTKPGELIRSDRMLTNLYWINNNPFRATTLTYQKGQNLGETDVHLETEDRLPFRPYMGTQDTGNKIAGRARYFAGFNLGNLWGLDHSLNYQYIRATTVRRYWGHSGGYNAPLPWHHLFKVFGTYTKTNPYMSHQLDLIGKGWQLSGRYEVPFVKWNIIHTPFLNYDFKRTNNFLSFVKNTIYNTFIDISQFALGYEGVLQGKKSYTAFGGSVIFSPGNMTKYNKTQDFEQERSGVTSRYFYARLHFDRKTPLFWNLSWWLAAQGQYSNKKLLPSEEFSVGGYLSVRGYLENQFIGDSGLCLRNELRLPSLELKKLLKFRSGSLQVLGFLDYGKVWDADSNIRFANGTTLSSIGPGIRYEFEDKINAWCDVGWQLKTPLKQEAGTSHRVHVGITIAY